jgi:SGNH hydrolase-like domain, acetyltransferase AlgX
MQKFTIRLFLFLVPLIILRLFAYFFYEKNAGDLPNQFKNYRAQFNFTPNNKNLPQVNFSQPNAVAVLSFGDSFSGQGNFAYPNILNNNLPTANFAQSTNPALLLVKIINSGWLKNIQAKYILLEQVERLFAENFLAIDTNAILTSADIKLLTATQQNSNIHAAPDDFFSKSVFKIPFTVWQYYNQASFLANNRVYVQHLNNSNYFTCATNKLLFYKADVDAISINNDVQNLAKANTVLHYINNKLAQQKIKFTFFVAPNKLTFYYKSLNNTTGISQPQLFTLFNKLPKSYHYINTLQILQTSPNKKDVYLFDDTHWSPATHQLLADTLLKIVQ